MLSEDECYSSDGGGGYEARELASAYSTDPEEWQDYHSEFLVAAWHRLKDHIASMGVYVLDSCTFSDFAQFCFERSSGRKPPC